MNKPNHTLETEPRQSGKSCHAYLGFVSAIEAGKKALYVGPDYVVMPLKEYKKLIKEATK